MPALLACGCTSASMYYPDPVPPLPGWQGSCAGEVDATVIVENTLDLAVELHELLADGCEPSARGTVGPGESADLGQATGPVWRAVEVDSREWLATFRLEDGENVLVLE